MLHNNKNFIINNASIVIDTHTITEKASLSVENGIIKAISKTPIKPPKGIESIDAHEKILGPGLIDMHIHGCAGFDTASVIDNDVESSALHMEKNISNINDFLTSQGITSFQLAIVPSLKTLFYIQKALQNSNAQSWKDSLIGVYTEGPFINERKRGGISLESILAYTKENLDAYLHFTRDNGQKLISCMTIAPELIKTDELYQELKDNDIKAAWGHSCSFLDELPNIKDIHITHLFNAMTPLDHKRQGLAGLPFLRSFQDATFELICDTVHVCPEMLELVFTTIGTKNLCLISDGMSQAGLPKGEFEYMGKIAVNDGICCRYKDDGLLIGSSMLINKTGQMLFKKGLITVNEFFQIASTNPAKALNLSDRGSIEVGKRADLLLVDNNLNITDIFCT